MASSAENNIKTWREEQKLSANVLAEHINCDVTTVYRYESGKIKPTPDVMYQICMELGNLNRWCTWMREEYPASYARIHPETPMLDINGTLMTLYADLIDALEMQSEIFRGCASGELEKTGRFKQLILNINATTQYLLNEMNLRRV